MNNVSLLGRFGRDPELRFFGSGSCKARFSLSVDNRVKRDGEWVKEAVWVECEAWGKLASDVIAEYCRKGTQVAVSGSLKVEQWTDAATSNKRSKMLVNVQSVFMTGSKDGAQGQSRPSAPQSQSVPGYDGPPMDSYADPGVGAGGGDPYREIPFTRFDNQLNYGA